MKMPVSDALKLSGFVLVGVGTLGLLVNEFAVDGGRALTISFAVLNLVGLIFLAFPRPIR